MVVGEFAQDVDVVVIGGGPGGYTCALAAAGLGMEVSLVESRKALGGVCLQEGCIPSKTVLHAAEVIEEAKHATHFGIEFAPPKINLDGLRARKQEVVDKLAKGVAGLCKKAGVEVINGRASFEDGRTLRLTDSEVARLKFRRCVIATGSRPATIPLFEIGSDRIMDSTGALELGEVPKTLLVVGGGYIGLELGSVYAALGSKVTVVEMLDGILPGADRDLVRPLEARINTICEAVYTGTKVTGVKEVKGGVKVTMEGPKAPKEATFEKVLVSVGRKPNTDNIGLEHTTIRPDKGGFIAVNKQMQTAEPRIYAIGDVAGQPMLAHKAIREAAVAARVMAGKAAEYDNVACPAVVFTDPEIAWAGLTETEAKRDGIEYVVKKMPWGGSGRAATLGRQDGMTKRLCDPQTQRVLGVVIVGTRAGYLISDGVLAIQMAAVAEDLASIIHPHPTLSETIGELAGIFGGGAATH